MVYPDKVRIGDIDYLIPFAAEVPYDEKQLAELEEDIRAAGKVEIRVILWKERSTPTTETVVDGIHRILMAHKVGLAEVPYEHQSFETVEEARAACVRFNLKRRQLTSEQLAEQKQKRVERVAQARCEGMSIRLIGAREGVSHATVENDLDITEAKTGVRPKPGTKFVKSRDGKSYSTTRKPRRTAYGDPIDFRGLRHAPVNEQGVVFLFGMVAHKLGFLVESVQGPYPDCEGKRQIRAGKWEKVRIEFEFESRNFKLHGHAPDGCDVIVCWEHNWPECPPNIEVIELKKWIAEHPSPTASPG
jgi:hypothetical protein